jgi:hypothetical protein
MKDLQVVTSKEQAELGGDQDDGKKKRKQSERLHDTVKEAQVELFHDPEGRTYATIDRSGHLETWPIRSAGFRLYVTHLYFNAFGEPPRANILNEFLGVLEGRAQFEGAQKDVHVRIAPDANGGIVVDLGDDDWSVTLVTSAGWQCLKTSPVKFLRPRGLSALPAPVTGGSLDLLRPFLNVADEDQWKLLVGCLIGMYRPAGPYPVLGLRGEQGTAKTTAMRVIRKLVDPRRTLDRTAPRDDRDLAVHAMHHWIIALDNMSGLQDWLSDGLARLATGSGFSTRQLYTDSEEFSFNAARPIMINGIGDVIHRSDLLDRAVLINFAPISEAKRRSEEEFWAEFELVRPKILGAALDAVVGALGRVGTIRLASLPRMADFARFVTAAEPALGWKDGTFLSAYRSNRASAHELALDADPVAGALQELVSAVTPVWEGQATALLIRLGEIAGETAMRQPSWPKAAHSLSNRLERLAPNLRAVGIEITRDRSGAKRTIRVSKAGTAASPASRPSSPGRGPAVGRDAHDAGDARSQAPDAQHPPLKLRIDFPDVSGARTTAAGTDGVRPCPGCGRTMVPTHRVDRPFVCTNPGHSVSPAMVADA